MKYLKNIALTSTLFVFFLAMGFFCLGTGAVVAVTPTISSVSGSVSNGQTLTINGTALVDDVKTNWDTGSANCGNQEPNFTSGTSYGFEGSSPANDCYGTGTSETGSTVSYSSAVKIAGNNSIRFHIQGQHTDTIAHNPRASGIVYNTQGKSSYYVRTYARWDLNSGSWPSHYMKMFWSSSSGGNTYFMQPNVTTQMCVLDGWIYGCVPFTGNNGNIQSGRWYAVEWLVNPVGDILGGWIDNKEMSITGNYSGTTGWFEFGFINLNGTTSAFNIDHYMDNLVISSSRIYPSAFIEIGNSSNYLTATRVTQPVVYFSDGTADTVQITADLTSLGSGPYYLFITNNNQERSAAYALSGGGGDTTPPTSPTNLAATSPSQSSISVTWNPATDNVGVTGYIVERCQGSGCTTFTQVGTPASSPFVDSGLTAGTFYNYHVRAVDGAGNLSGWSNVVGATTQTTTTAPSFTLTANPTSITSGQSSTLTWSAVTNATSCTASGGTFTGTKSTSGGTQSVSPTSTTTYTLSCTGAGGTTNRTATVTVTTGGGTGTTFLDENFDDANYSGYLDTSGGNNIDTTTKRMGAGAFKCSFASGATKCTGNTSMRYVFPESESVYLSYWVKYSPSWTGSNKAYHPHMFYFLTNLDDIWSGFNGTHLTIYVEENEGIPLLALQDSANINGLTNPGQPPTSGFGQNHSVAGCNGLFDGSSHPNTTTSCYWDGSEWNNDRGYKANQIYFSNTCPGPYCKTDWHRVEAYFKMNTVTSGNASADGVMQMWYDGTKILDYGNIMYRTGYNDTANGLNHATQKFQEFAFSPYIGDGSPVAQDMWIDDLQVRDVPPTSSSFTPCNTVTTANFSQAAYNSYGAPFDPFTSNTPLLNVTCNSADTDTINLTTGITGDTTRIVYTKGYWFDSTGSAWRQYAGTCTGALNGEWCQGSVSATITDANVSTASSTNPTYLVGMTCSVQGGSWKCGCRDTTCANFSWQIQGAGM